MSDGIIDESGFCSVHKEYTCECARPKHKLKHAASPGLDALLGTTFPVLDQGFIRVVDYMGNDDAIVQAARISYGKGTKQVTADRGLLRYLLRNNHTTPFEMCRLKLHVRVPMDCWRQWIRHRTASVNEYSTRYSEAIDRQQVTEPNEWRRQGTGNRQGSDGMLKYAVGAELSDLEQGYHLAAGELYRNRLACGVAREQARKDLPLSTYTEAYWAIDLHNLLHFLKLRMDSHAQHEIRQYATVIGEKIVSVWVPHVWEAFQDYKLDAMQLSSMEVTLVKLLVRKDYKGVQAWLDGHNWITDKGDLSREAQELDVKLIKLGFNLRGELSE